MTIYGVFDAACPPAAPPPGHGKLCRYPVLSALCLACALLWAKAIKGTITEDEWPPVMIESED